MNIHRLYARVSPMFRRRRMRRFVEEIKPQPATTILDVGGCAPTWDYIDGLEGRITLINIPSQAHPESTDRLTFVTGDGTALPYADGSFGVVFSNSVIEHVGDITKQEQFAREASRVGKALWIQTPAREFFIEPHLIAPFFHWLPATWQRRVARRFTVWGLMTKPTPQQVHEFLGTIRLLTAAEMRALFPDCEIIVERFLGMPKSYVAVRRTALTPQAPHS